MEPRLLGWPEAGPTLRLDHRRFSYAGKFVMSNTGKAVIRDADRADEGALSGPSVSEPPGEPTPPGDAPDSVGKYDTDVLAAVAFNEDRTDPDVLWIRYVTLREDLRGEGLGPQLCRFLARRGADRGYDRLRIAVNNPFAYEALYRAGFSFTGEETGIAELVLERPAATPAPDRSAATYQAGLDAYRARDLSAAERAFLERRRGSSPPSTERHDRFRAGEYG
jgi:GNAT superfamily N-acetyltransferase